VENGHAVQYRNEYKTNVSHFALNCISGNYRDYQGTGNISKTTCSLPTLNRDINAIFKSNAIDTDLGKSTFIHNPNWKFLQPTTLSRLIMSNDDCPQPVAELIASFVVECKIKIGCFQYKENKESFRSYNDNCYLEDFQEFNDVSAHRPVEKLYNELIEETYYDDNKLKEQFIIDLDAIGDVDTSDFKLVQTHCQKIPKRCLVGDVFGNGKKCLVFVLVENRVFMSQENSAPAMK